MVSVVILAAGFGTRMKSNLPKVLHKVCGKPMLYHVIDKALSLSSDIKIILFNQKDLIIEKIKSDYPSFLLDKISFVVQNHELFPGTGGALMDNNKQCINFKNQNILILSGDTPLLCENELDSFCKYAINENIDILVGATNVANPSGYGRIILDSKNNLEKIVEHKDANEAELKIKYINSGIYFCKKNILDTTVPSIDNNNAQKEYYLTDIIKHSHKSNLNIIKKTYQLEENHCKGVNSKLELSQVEEIMLNILRNEAMKNGVIMHLPQTIYIECGVKFIGECEIEANTQIIGTSIIENSHIKANSTIKDSHISESDIGPNAHIRPKCQIHKSHIGNFVECKNAILDNIKAGHLSYLGDCEIGNNTNVGAGVIICNYDGKNKHKTIIGKNVFIGSDTQIIAPINIADDILIAAGSTVTKDIKSGSFVIARSQEKIIENGYSKFFKK